MKIKDIFVFLFICAVSVFFTCSPRIYSPPGRLWPLESPSTLLKSENAVSFTGGIHFCHSLWSSFSAGSGVIGFRHGFTENFDASMDLSLLCIDKGNREVNTSPIIGGIRFAGKYNPPTTKKWFAFRFGLVGGSSVGGLYADIDGGFIFGYENPYVVPFNSLGFFISIPINAKTVDLGKGSDHPDSTNQFETPTLTNGIDLSVGLKFPFGNYRSNKYRFGYTFNLLYSFTSLENRDFDDDYVSSFGGAFEFCF